MGKKKTQSPKKPPVQSESPANAEETKTKNETLSEEPSPLNVSKEEKKGAETTGITTDDSFVDPFSAFETSENEDNRSEATQKAAISVASTVSDAIIRCFEQHVHSISHRN